MSGAVVYYSNYGSTRQYAEWVAQESGFTLFDQKTATVPWDEFDTVVIGSPTVKMQPFLAKWIKEHWVHLKGKRVVLFSTSGAEPSNPALCKGFEAAFPPEISSHIAYFPLHGKLVWNELRGLHKLLMRIGQMIEKDPVRKAEMVKEVDGVDRASIGPLVETLREAV